MQTKKIETTVERDILSIMRELEKTNDAKKVSASSSNTALSEPDPVSLRNSLEQKLTLINLLDGYSEAKEITKKKEELQMALGVLDQIMDSLPVNNVKG